MDDKDAAQRVTEIRDDVITFALQQLSTENHRDDYKELLELTVFFLGGIPPKGIKFRYPGAFHRARWMARAIYAIKMWLFRDEFPIQKRQRGHLDNPTLKRCGIIYFECPFTYVKYWFTCTSPAEAPRNDLHS